MNDIYMSPLLSRYAGNEMKYVFSEEKKIKTWRKLWVVLAESQKELGLNITNEQIKELNKFKNDINYDVAKKKEKETKHDVMAHVYAYSIQCKKASPIIHLGATSCYVTDNTDIILMVEALYVIRKKIIGIISVLRDFAFKYKSMQTLSYTHLQPAQPTTVGKRATLWIQDLITDLESLNFELSRIKLLGSKGTTGTQASFLKLFDGDYNKVQLLDIKIVEKLGFKFFYPVSGQTYSRKLDSQILSVLSGVAQSCTKFSNDIRFLQHLKEIEEPFEENQIGSSAMAYKRNPMRCERICALSRYVMINSLNPVITASSQWLERTLDDSANKRLSIPEAFLATDSILNLYFNVVSGLKVYPEVIKRHLIDEIPFMITEDILMDTVKRGGNRQELHERIRMYSMDSYKKIKEDNKENDLLEKIIDDPIFGLTRESMDQIINSTKFIGIAPIQTESFLLNVVDSIINCHSIDCFDEIQV